MKSAIAIGYEYIYEVGTSVLNCLTFFLLYCIMWFTVFKEYCRDGKKAYASHHTKSIANSGRDSRAFDFEHMHNA